MATPERSRFLDALRSIAILRVIAWHAYGAPIMTWFVAAMPTMFFIAGSLYAGSIQRGTWRAVTRSRLWRVLLPLGLFTLVAFSHMAATARSNGSPIDFEWWRPLQWVFPVFTPDSPSVDATWWSAHLWYLRAFVQLVIVGLPLLWLFKRLRAMALALPVVMLVVISIVPGADATVPVWTQELILYSFFWMFGYAHHEGWIGRLSSSRRFQLSIGFATLAAVWALTHDGAPGGIVNSSNQLHLLVGLAWLFLFLSLEGAIARVAGWRGVRPVVDLVNRRAVTIYLWQTIAIWIALSGASMWVLEPTGMATPLVLPVVLLLILPFVLVFGWVEDVAAGLTPRVWPRPADRQRTTGGAATAGQPPTSTPHDSGALIDLAEEPERVREFELARAAAGAFAGRSSPNRNEDHENASRRS